MVQDYARSAKRHSKKMAQENSKQPLPTFLILITLLVIAGFGCFLYYLMQVKPEIEQQPAAEEKAKPIKSVKKKSVRQPPAAQDSYDFYTLLPESEVIAPEVDSYNYKDKKERAQEIQSYLLQAGSFRRSRDADSLRAQLILKGLDAKVSKISSKGSTWHRVLVGPFTSRSALNRAQDILADANTESMLIKVK